MWAVLIFDRLESASVGWSVAVDEAAMRLLLPCSDDVFEAGLCGPTANLPAWPEADDPLRDLPVSSFAWTCRAGLISHEIFEVNYRSYGKSIRGSSPCRRFPQTFSVD